MVKVFLFVKGKREEEVFMKASIALQVLPLAQGIDRIAVIDQVIAYLQAQEVTMVVTPFETVLEGEFDELMRILKEALEVAGQEADNVFANVKINVGEILSIDEKLEKYINEYGKENVGMIVMTITNNSAGGQPVSMQNLREVSAVAKKYGILFNIDAARFAENAYFIKEREAGYNNKSIKDIVREMFSYADTFTMSAKKDAIVNMGGLIGIKNNKDIYQLIKGNCISFEGFITYGGLSGRDLEALAIGLYEGIDEEYLKYRNASMEYLASQLLDAGVAIQNPAGGHGVYVDANAMFPHIPYYEFPGHTLCIELYKEAGIRTCDIGSFMLGNDPETGKQIKSEFEFARLAIPRRVYTQAHLDVIAEALINIKERASQVKGYRIIWEPPILRHFQAHLEPIK